MKRTKRERERERETERERHRFVTSERIVLHMHENEPSGMRKYFTPPSLNPTVANTCTFGKTGCDCTLER